MTQGKEEILNFKKLEVIRVSGDVDMANVLRAVLKRTVLSSCTAVEEPIQDSTIYNS